MTILGVTLIAAALVIPAVVARLLTNSFVRMLVISVVVGAFSGFLGVYLSYYLNISSGASVVLVGAALFVVVFTFSELRGCSASRSFSRGSLALAGPSCGAE